MTALPGFERFLNRKGLAMSDPFLPQQPDLDALRQARVGKQRGEQNQPVKPRQVHQTKRRGQWGIRQPRPECHDGQCREGQGPACPALKEGDFIGANDMDNECLRHQRLDEPAGLK